MAIFTLPINEFLVISESNSLSIKAGISGDSLALLENFDLNIYRLSDNLAFSEAFLITREINREIADSLVLTEVFVRQNYTADLADVLTLTESLPKNNSGDELNLNEVLTYSFGKGIFDQLDLTEIIDLKTTRGLVISESLGLIEGFVGFNSNDLCNPITIVNSNQVSLNCNGDLIILSSPDFDDSDRTNYNRVNGKTRGGDPIIFRQSSWPKSRIISYKWSYIKPNIRDNLIRYLRRNLGKRIILTNHENISFNVIIENPDASVFQQSRFNHEISLSFEVE